MDIQTALACSALKLKQQCGSLLDHGPHSIHDRNYPQHKLAKLDPHQHQPQRLTRPFGGICGVVCHDVPTPRVR